MKILKGLWGEKGQVYKQTSLKQTVFLCVFRPSKPTETSNSDFLPNNIL